MDTPAYLVPGITEWLIILPILNRLYTSVIVWNPGKCGLKVSCTTDMSPTTILSACLSPLVALVARTGGEGCTRGGVWLGWAGGAIPVPHQYPPRTLIFNIF